MLNILWLSLSSSVNLAALCVYFFKKFSTLLFFPALPQTFPVGKKSSSVATAFHLKQNTKLIWRFGHGQKHLRNIFESFSGKMSDKLGMLAKFTLMLNGKLYCSTSSAHSISGPFSLPVFKPVANVELALSTDKTQANSGS